MSKRIEWVDIGKFICIMFVMLSHLQSGSVYLDRIYQPFFLTVFFFLSGYVYRQPKSFKEHLVKKAKGLIVPWLIFSNFNILLSALITLKGERNSLNEFLWNLLQIRGVYDGLWFVAALFVAFIPFYFFIKRDKPASTIIISVALVAVSEVYSRLMPAFSWGSSNLPWHLEYIFKAMIWMVLGYYFRQSIEEKFDTYNKLPIKCGVWAAYLIIVELFAGDYHSLISIPLSYIKMLLGVVSIIFVCKSIKSNKYFAFVGANTLTYFGLHGKVYAVIEKVLETACGGVYEKILNNDVASVLIAIAITVLMSIVLIPPAVIINKWFPWILGRKKRNKE